MKKIQWKPLIISLVISLGTGGIASLLTYGSMKKYSSLYQPPLAPPAWVFPVVWTILFILMGIASYLVYITGGNEEKQKQSLKTYVIQLMVNVSWSVIFFRFDAYFLAFICLALLWYLVLKTTIEFYGVNKMAGKLMIPYLLWVTFAGYLNFAIAIHYPL